MLLSQLRGLRSLQANAKPGRSDARYASLADTLWKAFCPSGSSSSWSSGPFGLAPPGLVFGRAARSPSSATASSAWRGSAFDVNPESLYVTQRFKTVASLSVVARFQILLSAHSLSFSDGQSRSSLHPARMKSSPCTTMSKSQVACPNAHGQLLELRAPTF